MPKNKQPDPPSVNNGNEPNENQNELLLKNLFEGLNMTFSNILSDLNSNLASSLTQINRNISNLTEAIEENNLKSDNRNVKEFSSVSAQRDANLNQSNCVENASNRNYIAAFKDLGGHSMVFVPGGSIHPVNFIKKLSRIFDEAGVPGEKKIFFALSCLRGSAQHWGNLKEDSFIDYEQFKKCFLERYWSVEEEREVFRRVKFGSYSGGSKADYFIRMLGEIKLLSDSLTEAEQIEMLINHFPAEVRKSLFSWGVKTVEDIEKFLRRLDSVEQDNTGDARHSSTSSWRDTNRARGGGGRLQSFNREPRNNENVNRRESTVPNSSVGARRDVNNQNSINRESNDAEVANIFKEDLREFLTVEEEIERHVEELTVLPTIEVVTEGLKNRALIDTGSQITCVSGKFAEQLKKINKKLPELPTNVLTISGALGKQKDQVREQIYIAFQIKNVIIDFPCLVVPSLVRNIIFGCDWMKEFKATINVAKRNLAFWVDGEPVSVEFVGESVPSTNLFVKEIICEPLSEIKNNNIINYSESEIYQVAEQSTSFNGEEKKKLGRLLMDYQSIFSDQPGLTDLYEHEIILRDYSPFYLKSYPVPYAHREEVQKQIREMIEWGIIRKSQTEYVSPLVVVTKKCGQLRVCLDARHLNARMVKDHAQPPNPGELVYGFAEGQCLSSLDLTASYWQIPIKQEHQKYTGFYYQGDTYVFQVLPFGLSTSVASFIRGLNKILGELDEFMIPYVDDLLIFSPNSEEHLRHLAVVFEKFRDARVTVKLRKCRFAQAKVSFLGHIITPHGIEMDEKRIDAISNFPVPKNIKGLRSFLGFVNYDRRFCKDFAQLTLPLLPLLRKGVLWKWGPEENEAFNQIKRAFLNTVLLKHPRLGERFFIETDASNLAIGGILYQRTTAGDKNIISFNSKILKNHQLKYTVTEKEAYAILNALQEWRIFVLGQPLTVVTDHKSLAFLNSCRLLNCRLTRWILYFQEFEFDIKYCKGKENVLADTLSRYPSLSSPMNIENPESPNLEINMSDIKLIQNHLKNLPQLQRDDDFCSGIINQLLSEDCKERIKDWYLIYKSILFRNGSENNKGAKICLPKELLGMLIIEQHENHGHFGREKCLNYLNKYYYNPKLKHLISKVLAGCELCQKSKVGPRSHGEMGHVIPKGPNEITCTDLMGPLPISRGGVNFILVMVDAFSKYICIYALKRATTKNILNCFFNKYIPKMGKPKAILSDNGTQFTSELWLSGLLKENIQVRHTSVYFPQGNLTERFNREIGRIIRALCHFQHTKWSYVLPQIEYWLNRSYHSSTGFTPYELHFGRVMQNELIKHIEFPNSDHYELPEGYIYLAYENLLSKAAKRKMKYDLNHSLTRFSEGDKVLLRTHYHSSSLSKEIKKFFLLYDGPYLIKSLKGQNSYELMEETGVSKGVHNIYNLKPFVEPYKM